MSPWTLKENVTEEPGLKLGLEEWMGKEGCSTQICFGKWSSLNMTLLSLLLGVHPPKSSPLLHIGHIHIHTYLDKGEDGVTGSSEFTASALLTF